MQVRYELPSDSEDEQLNALEAACGGSWDSEGCAEKSAGDGSFGEGSTESAARTAESSTKSTALANEGSTESAVHESAVHESAVRAAEGSTENSALAAEDGGGFNEDCNRDFIPSVLFVGSKPGMCFHMGMHSPSPAVHLLPSSLPEFPFSPSLLSPVPFPPSLCPSMILPCLFR